MQALDNELSIFIILTVVLFMALGVAIIIIIDHKARIPGDFVEHPFAIIGRRNDHPFISFLSAIILLSIIAVLVFEIAVTLTERVGVVKKEQKSELLQQLHETRFTERMRHFHNEPVNGLVDAGKKQACYYCHGDYPHSKTVMIRTILNMHTQFIGCMTCHTDEKKIPEDLYRFAWLNYSGIEVNGPPYGTSNDPGTGFLVVTDDYYSKIVIYNTAEEDGDRLLELTEDNPEVQEFASLTSSGDLADEDREGLKRRFHMLLRGEAGRICSRCHAEEDKSYLPFRELGFSGQRVADLTDLDIIGVVEKYSEFYFPDLLKSERQTPIEQMATGNANNPGPVSGVEGNTTDSISE